MQVLAWLGVQRSDLVLLVLLVVAGLNVYSFIAHKRATVEIKQLLLRLRSESFARSPLGRTALGTGFATVSHRRFVGRAARILGSDEDSGDPVASYGE